MSKPLNLILLFSIASMLGCEEPNREWRSLSGATACKMSATKEARSTNAYAYVAHNDDYAIGALVSAKSLKPFTSQDIVVLLTGSVSKEITNEIQDHGFRTIWVEDESVPNSKLSRYRYSMVKVCPFALTEYKKILLVDSDTLVYDSIDYLLEKDLAVGEILGTTDAFSRLKDINTDLVSTALFMFIPDEKTFSDLIAFNDQNPQDADMDLVNNFFAREKKKILNIPFYLNWQFNWEGIPPSMFSDVKVLHFNAPKPWNQYDKGLSVSDTNFRFYEDWKNIREKI